MKRSQIVFVAVVFATLVTGILLERTGDDDPYGEFAFTAPVRIQLAPVVVPSGAHSLTGLVRDAEGAPAFDVRVHLWRPVPVEETAERLLWDATDAAGRFEIVGIPEGSYRVALLQPEIPNTLFTVRIPEEREVEWTLHEPRPPLPALPEMIRADLSGKLAAPEGVVRATLSLESYEVVLLPAPDVDPLSGAVLRRVLVAADGAFAVPGLVEADYRIQVLPPWAMGGSWPVLEEVAYAHRDVSGNAEPLDLVLQTGEVTGLLMDTDGRPIEGALVRVWPEGQERRLWPPRQTDEFGAFLVEDLPPGSFVVRVRAGEAAVTRTVAVRTGERTRIPFDPLATHAAD